MTKHLTTILIALGTSFSLPAALVSASTPLGADTALFDTATGLTWMKTAQTVNTSWTAMAALLQTGGTLEGWRYSDAAERQQFFLNAGIPIVPGTSASNMAPIESFLTLLGTPIPQTQNLTLYAYIGTGSVGARDVGGILRSINGRAEIGGIGLTFADSDSFSNLAHWIVTTNTSATPEPGSVVLLGSALALGAGLLRRKK